MKGRAEACGHRKRGGDRRRANSQPGLHAQEKEEEKGMPIIVVEDNKTKMVMAKVVTSNGLQEFAVEVVRRFVEQLGYPSVIMKSDNELATFALKEAVRREADRGDCHGGGTGWRPPGKRSGGEPCEERARPAPGVEECIWSISELRAIIKQYRGW